jgi:hypothetical protein
MAAVAQELFGDGLHAGATFSDDREYRYRLFRSWNEKRPPVTWLMLNPSTADERILDNTVRGCLKRAMDWNYGELWITNLFALRSTDPRALYEHADPVGPDNDEHIAEVVDFTYKRGGIVIAGWGTHGKLRDRGEFVRQKIGAMGHLLYTLHVNADGSPKHPLYVAHDVMPTVWR